MPAADGIVRGTGSPGRLVQRADVTKYLVCTGDFALGGRALLPYFKLLIANVKSCGRVVSAFYLVTWKKRLGEGSSRGLVLLLPPSGLYSTQNLGTVLERAVAADGKLADPMNAEIAILKYLIYRKGGSHSSLSVDVPSRQHV
jgi:hypothetical protein